MTQPYAIQGITPLQVYQTWNLTELSAAIADCRRHNRPICDYGRFHTGLGHTPPTGYAQIITALGLVEHYIADMTVCLRAATPLSELQRDLASHRQWLPIDGMDESMTLGEIVAHNVYGPLRIGFGSMRDMLLGMRFVDAQGTQITVGGRTVKNVAGYDVTRFMIGNLNTLGILTELTLRTWALPQCFTHVELIGADLPAVCRQLTSLMLTDAAPCYLDMRQIIGQPATIVFGYCGDSRACDAQMSALDRWLTKHSVTGDRRRHDGKWENQSLRASMKLIVPPARTADAVEALEVPVGSILRVLPAHGVIHVCGEVDAHVTQLARELGGVRIWVDRPNHLVDVAPFAPVPPDWVMLKRVKRAMDPANLFNPTRLWGNDG